MELSWVTLVLRRCSCPRTLAQHFFTQMDEKRIEETTSTFPLISSPLGFVPNPDGTWRKIHHLSFPESLSVNDYISADTAYIYYVSFLNVLEMVQKAGKGCFILWRHMKDAFRMIPVAPHQRWLLAFERAGKFYKECVLLLGLRTALFIFNLLAEAFHWILVSYLRWEFLEHYLDDIWWPSRLSLQPLIYLLTYCGNTNFYAWF